MRPIFWEVVAAQEKFPTKRSDITTSNPMNSTCFFIIKTLLLSFYQKGYNPFTMLF
jgi:hypothetical protein